jgi:DNA replication protein DnaC
MTDDIDQLLVNLKMRALRDIVEQELERALKTKPSYPDFLGRLLRKMYDFRRAQSLEYRIRSAGLPERWTLETFPFDKQTGVHAPTIKELAELTFLQRRENIVLLGPTGVGKTGLGSAILLKALENGYRGMFIKAQDLFEDIYASVADRTSRKLINRLARLDLLVIDEMGYLQLKPEQTNLFFKLMEERYSKRSTIITTNLDYEAWYDFLGRKEMVGALLSRLRHKCHTLRIDGPSLRTPADTA